jgi:hypothetical protein
MGRAAPADEVGAVRGAWIATAAVAAVAVVAVLVVARGGTTRGLTPTAPVSVQASFDRTLVGFGDRVTARVVVLLDPNAVDPSRLDLQESLAPLEQLGPTRVTRTARGRVVAVTYDADAVCMSEACVSPRGRQLIRLPAVRASVGTTSVDASWPALDVRGRVAASDLGRKNPPLQADVTPPRVGYRIAPAPLAVTLELVAALLAAAGIALGGWYASTLYRARLRRTVPLTEIERALLLAREAESRPPPDRRRALGLLARLLRNERLAGTARDLAWSAPAPSPDDLSELVTQVEHEVNGR